LFNYPQKKLESEDEMKCIGHNAWHNDSELTVHVLNYEPRVNWYDFQYNNSGTWISRLNKKIEIDNSSEYRFIINISKKSDIFLYSTVSVSICTWRK